MEYRHQKLQQDLAALSTAFTQLGNHLAGVAKEITSPGVVPSAQLVERLTASRSQFEAIRAAVHQLAADMLVSPMPKIDEVGTVTSIESLLKSAIVAEESKNSVDDQRAAALAILGRVLSIRHRDMNDFKPLLDCHAIATVTRDAVAAVRWPHQHADSALLIAEKHPFSALLTLVEHRDDLDDERWIVLEETVAKHYGKQLTVAASRGKLFQSAGSPAPASTAASPPAAKPAAAPEAPKPAETGKPAATPPPAVEAQSPAPAAPAAPEAPKPASEAPKSASPAAKPAPEAPKPAPAPAAEAPKPVPAPEAKPVAPVFDAKPTAPVADAKPASAAKTAAEVPAVKAEPAKFEKKEASANVEQAAVVVAAAPAASTTPASRPTVEAAAPVAATVAAPAPEARHSSAPPAEAPSDKKREPRLASVPAAAPIQAVQVEVKAEDKASDPSLDNASSGADLGQRPQRWGFWRGNR